MRKFIWLLIAIVLVVGAWTGGWFWLRGYILDEMDRQIAAAGAMGVEIDCPERSATGWPFRMEIACVGPSARTPDGRMVSAGAAAATLHVTNPKLVVVSLAPPLEIVDARQQVTATFSSLRASLRVEDQGAGRVSVSVDRPDVAIARSDGEVQVGADTVQVHLRPSPERPGEADVVVTATGVVGSSDNDPVLPAPADLGIDAAVSDAALLAGSPEAWAAAGGSVTVREAVFSVGDTRVVAEGTAGFGPDGRLDGTLDATATGIAWLTGAAQAGKPLPPALAALGSAFLLMGRPVEGEGSPRALAIAVEDGAVSANGRTLATLPPAF